MNTYYGVSTDGQRGLSGGDDDDKDALKKAENEKTSRQLLEQARRSFAKKNSFAAKKLLESIISEYPTTAAARTARQIRQMRMRRGL